MHAVCYKEIEMTDKQEKRMEIPHPRVGEKRPRVVYERFQEQGRADWQGNLASMIASLESDKKRKVAEIGGKLELE